MADKELMFILLKDRREMTEEDTKEIYGRNHSGNVTFLNTEEGYKRIPFHPFVYHFCPHVKRGLCKIVIEHQMCRECPFFKGSKDDGRYGNHIECSFIKERK